MSLVETLARVAAAGSPAAGDGHGAEAHGVDWIMVVSLFANFVLFFGFLYWVAAPAVRKGLSSRRANMAIDLERAQKKQAEAEARLAEYQAKLDNLEREVAAVVRSYEKEAAADRAKIEEETEKAIARLNRETEFTIQQEARKAEASIRQAAVEATLSAAEKKIRDRIEDDDHARLTERYVEELSSGGAS